MPGDTDEKTGDPVATVLQYMHLNARMPDTSMLPVYEDTPDFDRHHRRYHKKMLLNDSREVLAWVGLTLMH
jgi:hypothetical protein